MEGKGNFTLTCVSSFMFYSKILHYDLFWSCVYHILRKTQLHNYVSGGIS